MFNFKVLQLSLTNIENIFTTEIKKNLLENLIYNLELSNENDKLLNEFFNTFPTYFNNNKLYNVKMIDDQNPNGNNTNVNFINFLKKLCLSINNNKDLNLYNEEIPKKLEGNNLKKVLEII